MVSQVLLLSHPRTACHLLEKMLSRQERALYLQHPFVMAWPVQVKMLSEASVEAGIPEDIRIEFANEVQNGIEQWEQALDEARRLNKLLFLHTHPHFALTPDNALRLLETDGRYSGRWGNFTGIPDELLLLPGTVPIFTTRHPALVLPTAFRLMRLMETSNTIPNLKIVTHMAWNRELYEWYASHNIKPIVVDSDDYAGSDHENVVRHLCKKSGLDPDQALFHWPCPTQPELDEMIPMYVTIQRTLLNSIGVQPGPTAASVDLARIEASMRDEFGQDDADFLMGRIERAMPHYLFLKERRLVPPVSS